MSFEVRIEYTDIFQAAIQALAIKPVISAAQATPVYVRYGVPSHRVGWEATARRGTYGTILWLESPNRSACDDQADGDNYY